MDQNMLKMVVAVKYKMAAKKATTSYFSAYFAILNIIIWVLPPFDAFKIP